MPAAHVCMRNAGRGVRRRRWKTTPWPDASAESPRRDSPQVAQAAHVRADFAPPAAARASVDGCGCRVITASSNTAIGTFRWRPVVAVRGLGHADSLRAGARRRQTQEADHDAVEDEFRRAARLTAAGGDRPTCGGASRASRSGSRRATRTSQPIGNPEVTRLAGFVAHVSVAAKSSRCRVAGGRSFSRPTRRKNAVTRD